MKVSNEVIMSLILLEVERKILLSNIYVFLFAYNTIRLIGDLQMGPQAKRSSVRGLQKQGMVGPWWTRWRSTYMSVPSTSESGRLAR